MICEVKLRNTRAVRRSIFQIQSDFIYGPYQLWFDVYNADSINFLFDNHYIKWEGFQKLNISFTSKGHDLFVWHNFDFKFFVKYLFRKYILNQK